MADKIKFIGFDMLALHAGQQPTRGRGRLDAGAPGRPATARSA